MKWAWQQEAEMNTGLKWETTSCGLCPTPMLLINPL